MSELDDLLAACVAAPEDDGPRLVWADAIGGERGEFVVVQCKLAREELSPAERGALIARHDELLVAHGLEWSGFAQATGVRRVQFRRGLVEAIEADVVRLPLTKLFAPAPLLTSCHLRGIGQSVDYREANEPDTPHPLERLRHLFAQPGLDRLRAIEIDDAHLYETTGDTEHHFDATSFADGVLALIASSGALAGFRGLAIHDTFTERGIPELIGSNALASLEALAFRYGKASDAQGRELLAAMPNLRSLSLYRAIDVGPIADHLPPNLVELSACLAEGELEQLAASPIARQLERLELLGPFELAQLAAFPRVRSLVIRYAHGGASQIAALAKTSLPALRELSLPSETSDARAVAEAFGPQLDCLDIRGIDNLVHQTADLRSLVAGYVRGNETGFPWNKVASVTMERPLEIGTNTREPWLRHGLVPLSTTG
ncbi:MAG: hypothetical protein H0V17_33070 [Deltaproteobacteria bacterium]|nr:hypothetical protein [Deltaproteobacteria bacterium]